MTGSRPSYQRAIAAYDDAHERALLDAIVTAIAETSRVSDCNVIVLRTGEAASALISALAFILAASPSAVRSPTGIRKTMDELGEQLRRRVAAAEANLEAQDLVRRAFRSGDVGGSA